MSEFLDIAIVGAGNLAWHLAPALDNMGHRIARVYSRDRKAGAALIDRLYNAKPQITLDFAETRVNLIIVAVSDNAIQEVVSEMVVPDGCTLIHTSGSTSIEKLMYAVPDHAGVLYPLYSFSKKSRVQFQEIPLFIEGSDTQTEILLTNIGNRLSRHVFSLSSKDRILLHLAAVFANNFSNHMLTIAEHFMKQNDMPFHYLKTLVESSIQRAFIQGPYESQTGPAVRMDSIIQDRHMELLSNNPDLQEIYSLLSDHIGAIRNKKVD